MPLAYSASIVPVSTPGTASGDELIQYGEALVTINYSTKIVDQYSESLEPYTDFLKLPHQLFRWQDGSRLREEQAPALQMRGIQYVKTLLNVTTWDVALVNLIGYTNADSVSWPILGRTCDPETLLYQPPVITTKHDSTNNTKFDIVKKFAYNPNTWNTYYKLETNNWQRIYLADTGAQWNSYPLTAFNGTLV